MRTHVHHDPEQNCPSNAFVKDNVLVKWNEFAEKRCTKIRAIRAGKFSKTKKKHANPRKTKKERKKERN